MDTLLQIRDSFIDTCSGSLKIARVYDSFAHIVPDFRLHPEGLGFVPDMRSLIEMYEKMSESPDLVERMIQSQMVGEWCFFLEKIFEWHLHGFFSGRKSHRTVIELRLVLPEDLEDSLADIVQEKASRNFGRESYETQLDKVLNLLGNPIGKDNEHLQMIRKHKSIRDVIQHSRGRLRESDLKYLGVSKFRMAGDTILEHDERVYMAGDTVRITHYEIAQLAKGMIKAARAMIPDPNQE